MIDLSTFLIFRRRNLPANSKLFIIVSFCEMKFFFHYFRENKNNCCEFEGKIFSLRF